ncbi:hypothetical protein KSF_044930 [Reticulibacter mediterranei]|uniref:Uncharacterized protein n=1 Tax=Reticulibacter mediterranei TaxID=2778369 RepID=A0A8J3IL37_9CHLR|nr:hypothetical protein [Reticulibacter mediterranei]GHO94445.1 hypothetical protein KSF_044930 [Reticulibacter mediterranei]
MDIHLVATIAAAGVFLAHLLLASLIRRTIIATITGFSWQRTIFLKHFIWVKESSYSDYPDGSRNRSSTEESYLSYEFVRFDTRTTTDANGNTTTTTHSVYEPVVRYRTQYTYEIQRWRRSREVLAEGNDRNHVYWPDYTLDETTQEQIDKTQESYQVFFQATKGKQYHRELTQDEWTVLDEQATYRLRVTIYGTITDITPEQIQAMVMPEQQSAQ